MAKISYGIIGCGNIGPIHGAAIAQVKSAKLVAVSDVVEASAAALAGQYGAAVYTDYRKLLERDDIQAVCLCVPSGLRMEIAVDCAKAGKHILSEKPLDVTTKRIDLIIAAADAAGVHLGCIFQSRFADDSAKIKKALDEGRFGNLVLGDAYIKWYRSKEYYASGAWRGTKKLDGGGALMNQGIHQIDLLQWFMGKVDSVCAFTSSPGHEDIEVEDTAVAVLRFNNGALGVIEASTAVNPGFFRKIEILGTKGSVVLEEEVIKTWEFAEEFNDDQMVRDRFSGSHTSGGGVSDPKSISDEGHIRQFLDITEAIDLRRKPAIDALEARKAVEIVLAIYESAAKKKIIYL